MTEFRAHHDHTSCPLCEPGPLAGFCRHWKVERKVGAWHIMADGPDLMQRLVHPAHFVTILAYRPSTNGAQRTIEDRSTGKAMRRTPQTC